MQITTIGLDIAKNVFQLHGIDDAGQPVLRQKVRRDQLLAVLGDFEPCLIGIEACATAHHWARPQQRIIGLVNFKRLAMKSGLCHRLT